MLTIAGGILLAFGLLALGGLSLSLLILLVCSVLPMPKRNPLP